jgi:hypothetical protein
VLEERRGYSLLLGIKNQKKPRGKKVILFLVYRGRE